jgi:hypothetical protein
MKVQKRRRTKITANDECSGQALVTFHYSCNILTKWWLGLMSVPELGVVIQNIFNPLLGFEN